MNRLLAIGDIHGCYRAFDVLLSLIEFSTDDTLVLLGDYVDRGPRSRQVIDRIISLCASHTVFPLRGNHELMMIAARENFYQARRWMISGGAATLDSYNGSGGSVAQLSDVPAEHWKFLTHRLLPYYESENHIFVHGSVDPQTPMNKQSERTLCWSTYHQSFPGHISGKIVICGHELQESGLPATNGKSICIDTGAWDSGWLTCIEANSCQIWQANQRGKARSFMLQMSEDLT